MEEDTIHPLLHVPKKSSGKASNRNKSILLFISQTSSLNVCGILLRYIYSDYTFISRVESAFEKISQARRFNPRRHEFTCKAAQASENDDIRISASLLESRFL